MKLELTPTGATATADTGERLTGKRALAAFDRHVDEQQRRRESDICEHSEQVGASGSSQGHAPRTGDNERQRGSKRGDRSSSSSSDDPDPDPEPRKRPRA